jgi:putative exporter of polyketide antibiotics
VNAATVSAAIRQTAWVIDLSPYGHVPRMPVEGFAVAPPPS